MRRASPDARWWPAPLHRRRCGGQSLISATRRAVSPSRTPIPVPLCPLSSRNKGTSHRTRSAHQSRLAAWFHFGFSGGGCPGATSSGHRTSDVLRCTVAPASLRISAANLAGNGCVLNRAAALRGRCPQLPCLHACVRARMGGLSGDRLLFIHHVSLI